MVPKLTIPETSYDASIYTTPHRRSSLLIYLIRLTNGSSFLLIVAYIVGYFVIKPLLETKNERRLEILEKYRHKIRDTYLSLIGLVDYIPIVGIKKDKKVVVDTIIQTDESYLRKTVELNNEEKLELLNKEDKLSQKKLSEKLTKLSEVLNTCSSYSTKEMPHYKTVREDLKLFQHDIDTKLFNYDTLYSDGKRNLVVDSKNDIRSMKGLYMSGQI